MDQANSEINSTKESPDKDIITCEGCRYGYLGQRDHMNLGGCLYDSDESY